ncbi:hypothetical protein Taro_048082 [Colocasia esculenta]|uniref:Uncharacterized protein n=1 Tax=Colocasia esculenta TaxID=4460 RepID=A0A843X7N0_COLES|nr:hypothetical protein [Colocasia esculenta]
MLGYKYPSNRPPSSRTTPEHSCKGFSAARKRTLPLLLLLVLGDPSTSLESTRSWTYYSAQE